VYLLVSYDSQINKDYLRNSTERINYLLEMQYVFREVGTKFIYHIY